MKRREPITHIMTKDVVTVNVTNELADAENLLRKNNIRHIPVVSGENIIGMLSLTDLMRISFVDSYGDNESGVDTAVYNMLDIKQVMVKNPVTVESTATIKEVAEILAEKEFHALPVVEGNKLVGIVTTTDLIKFLLEQY